MNVSIVSEPDGYSASVTSGGRLNTEGVEADYSVIRTFVAVPVASGTLAAEGVCYGSHGGTNGGGQIPFEDVSSSGGGSPRGRARGEPGEPRAVRRAGVPGVPRQGLRVGAGRDGRGVRHRPGDRATRRDCALGNQVETTFDANGNPTEVDEIETTGHTSAKTFTTEMVYDDLDRRTTMRVVDQTNGSNKHTTTYSYTSLNVMVEKVDAESNATTWTHDGLGRVLSESIALGGGAYKTRSWGFDDNSRMVSHKDDGNNETTWAFNARDLPTTETYADTGAKTFDYDDADNLIFWDDPMGTEVDLTYDDNNRMTARDITRGTGVVGAQAEDQCS